VHRSADYPPLSRASVEVRTDFNFIVLPVECRRCATPEGVTILNCKYDLGIIDVHARNELFFIVHKSLYCEPISRNSNDEKL
jgi:hypothetical protein